MRVNAMTLASLKAGFNAHACFDDPRQFQQRVMFNSVDALL
jgi:hypothetical protein